MKRILLFAAVIGCAGMSAAQPQERGGRNFPPGDSMAGKVISIDKDSLVIEPLAGGSPVTVKISDSTRVNKDRQPAKLEDIKAGEIVFVRGELNNGILQSRMVAIVNAQVVDRMRQGGAGGGFGGATGRGAGAGFSREDWGKKFIAGEVKSINETRLTIARPDGQTADIEVDETTSFKRGRESITFPDIKVGDFVRGAGELKNNIFVPKELIVGRPQMRVIGDADKQNAPAEKPATSATPKN